MVRAGVARKNCNAKTGNSYDSDAHIWELGPQCALLGDEEIVNVL